MLGGMNAGPAQLASDPLSTEPSGWGWGRPPQQSSLPEMHWRRRGQSLEFLLGDFLEACSGIKSQQQQSVFKQRDYSLGISKTSLSSVGISFGSTASPRCRCFLVECPRLPSRRTWHSAA